MLRERDLVEKPETGPLAGCWVLPFGEGEVQTEEGDHTSNKVLVRKDGTATYTAKDIAFQLWKFGLTDDPQIGVQFQFVPWGRQQDGRILWSMRPPEPEGLSEEKADPKRFGHARRVINVIDVRQAYLQDVVAEGLRRLGHTEAAKNSVHFAYEIVALTPRCAAELNYELSPEEAKKPYVEVSGRKGFGVKADDLIDRLEAATLGEVLQRHAEMIEKEQKRTAHAIAVSALRFFLLKFTRNSIIAFDFKDALSFEGETGPYCQYAVVRIRGIRRKGAEAALATVKWNPDAAGQCLAEPDGADLWELLLSAGSLDYAVDAAIATQEPAFVAKYAFQLAQAFNNFYHKHHILSEVNEQKRTFLLQLTELVETQLVRALGLLGIEAPEKM